MLTVIKRIWFPPRPGNVVGAAPAAVLVLAAIMQQERKLFPENPFPPTWWQHAVHALDQTWLYGPVKMKELAMLAHQSTRRAEQVVGRLRHAGVIRSVRPEGWPTSRGVFYTVHLPYENAVPRLRPSQVRARSRARARLAPGASLEAGEDGFTKLD